MAYLQVRLPQISEIVRLNVPSQVLRASPSLETSTSFLRLELISSMYLSKCVSKGLPRLIISDRFAEWALTYGPIFSLKLGTQTVVVLSSPYMIRQLVDKQSAVYSNRPKSYVADNLVFHKDHLMFLNPDARWRRGRRLYHQHFNETLCETSHHHLQNAEATQFVRDLCDSPDDFINHCKRFPNSVIMSIGMYKEPLEKTSRALRQL